MSELSNIVPVHIQANSGVSVEVEIVVNGKILTPVDFLMLSCIMRQAGEDAINALDNKVKFFPDEDMFELGDTPYSSQ